MVKAKNIIIALIITLGIGELSGFLTMSESKTFGDKFNQSVLTPPDWVFPVVWLILYTLLGIGVAIVFKSNSEVKNYALILYGTQLVFNFLWPIFFFKGEQFSLSFSWITVLILLVMAMIVLFFKSSHISAYLQIPYLIWLLFAGYLTYIVCILN
jgi:tryptophan-rich sensory protein